MASEQNDAIPLLVKANQDEDVSTHPPIGVNSSPYRRGLGVTIAAVILCAAYPVSTALTATSPVVPVECANGGFMQQVRRTMVKNKGISPTIGILTQPNDLGSEFSKLGSSMLLRKIVDWLQGAGANVAVLRYDLPSWQLARRLSSINGVLLVGDHQHIVRHGGSTRSSWAEAAMQVWNFARSSHERQQHFPVFGIGSGFELLCYAAAGDIEVLRHDFVALNSSWPLQVDSPEAGSRLLSTLPGEAAPSTALADVLRRAHNADIRLLSGHAHGVQLDDFAKFKALSDTFNVVSTGPDRTGQRYVSTIEGKGGLPIYGTQWHPEWLLRSQAPANETAQESLSEAVRLLAGFFVHEATRNRICGAVSSTLGVSPTLMQSYQTKQVVLPGQAAPEAVYFFEKGEHLPALDGASEMNTFERAFVTQNVHRVRTFKLVAIGALAIIAIGVRLMWRWNIQTSRMRHENPEDKLQDIRHQRHAPHQFGATLLHEVFQRSVAKWPLMPCLKIAGPQPTRLTFAELDGMANGIAAAVSGHIMSRDAVVAMAMPWTGAEAFATYLGILKAGAAVLILGDVAEFDEASQVVAVTALVVADSTAAKSMPPQVPVLVARALIAESSCLAPPALSFHPDFAMQRVRFDGPRVSVLRWSHDILIEGVLADAEEAMLVAGVDAAGHTGAISAEWVARDALAAWASGVPVVVLPESGLDELASSEAITRLRCHARSLPGLAPQKFALPLLRYLVVEEPQQGLQATEKARWAKNGRYIRAIAANKALPNADIRLAERQRLLSDSAAASTANGSPCTMQDGDSASEEHQVFETKVPQGESVLDGGGLPSISHARHLERARYLHELFQCTAKRFPGAPCLKIAGSAQVWTYSEIQFLADKVTAALRQHVTAPDTIVAIKLPRDSEMPFAAGIGVMQAGASALMLDKSVPGPLQEYMVQAAGAALVIGAEVPGVANLPWARIAETRASAALAPPEWLRPEAAATVLFTSGSTGKPKGLRNPHNAYVHFHLHNTELLRLPGQGFVTAQMAKFGFDVSFREMFMPWCVGACLCVLPDSAVGAGASLPDVWRQENIGAICGVPSLLRAAGGVTPTLRVAYLAGEPAPSSLLRSLVEGGCTVVNGYGTSETPMSVCRAVYTGASKDFEPTIGSPVPGMKAVLLDEALEVVPRGETGEICIGGVQLTLGYLDATKSAVALIMHPEHGRLYRTGDLGRITERGTIEFLGRNDDQVKVAGNRLELAGVDAALQNTWGRPGLAKQADNGSLVAYVEAPPELAKDAPRCREQPERCVDFWPLPAKFSKPLLASLAQVLPPYGVPARVYAMAELPRTTVSRKVSRRMLPDPSTLQVDDTDVSADEVEAWVLETARQVFDDRALQLDDQLTTSGGTSISVARLAATLRTGAKAPALAVRYPSVTVKQVLQAGSLRDLAVQLRGGAGGASRAWTELLEHICPQDTAIMHERAMSTTAFTFLQMAWLLFNLALLSYIIIGSLVEFGNVTMRFIVVRTIVVSAAFASAWSVLVNKVLALESGVYPLWGRTHLKFWCAQLVTQPVLLMLLSLKFSFLLDPYLRALGVKLGNGVSFPDRMWINGFSFVDIGDRCTVGTDAVLEAVRFVKGGLRVGRIVLGPLTKVGVCSSIPPGTVLGAGCELMPAAAIQVPVQSPPNMRWEGNPAVSSPGLPEETRRRRAEIVQIAGEASAKTFANVFRIFMKVSLLLVRIHFSVWLVYAHFQHGVYLLSLGICPDCAFWLMIVIRIMMAMLMKRMVVAAANALLCRVLPQVPPGVHPKYSWMGVVAKLKVEAFGKVQKANASSVMASYWLTAAGAKVYPQCGNLEIGFMGGLLPDTLSISACNSSGAKTYSLMVEEDDSCITVRQSVLSSGCFVGNGAIVGAGVFRRNLTVGVVTWVPTNSYRMEAGEEASQKPMILFGNPPVEFPARTVQQSPDSALYEPTLSAFALRVVITDIGRCFALVPLYLVPMVLVGLVFNISQRLPADIQMKFLIGVTPIAALLWIVCLTALFICAKWLVVGRARESTHGMWDAFVQQNFYMWRLISWFMPAMMCLSGTLALNPILRALGLVIGHRSLIVDLNSYFDVDLLRIGSGVVLQRPRWQLHTFEDRILKLYNTNVGDGTLITNSMIVGGAHVHSGAIVLNGSCVLKGEELASNGLYIGAPVTCVGGNACDA